MDKAASNHAYAEDRQKRVRGGWERWRWISVRGEEVVSDLGCGLGGGGGEGFGLLGVEAEGQGEAQAAAEVAQAQGRRVQCRWTTLRLPETRGGGAGEMGL